MALRAESFVATFRFYTAFSWLRLRISALYPILDGLDMLGHHLLPLAFTSFLLYIFDHLFIFSSLVFPARSGSDDCLMLSLLVRFMVNGYGTWDWQRRQANRDWDRCMDGHGTRSSR
jgi:hypothetical protein